MVHFARSRSPSEKPFHSGSTKSETVVKVDNLKQGWLTSSMESTKPLCDRWLVWCHLHWDGLSATDRPVCAESLCSEAS